MKRYQAVSSWYGVSTLTGREKTVYNSLVRAADKVESKYDCAHCEHMNSCNEGQSCYKDYLSNKKWKMKR